MSRKLTGNVNAAKADANSQIAAIKAAKKTQYDGYQAYLEYLTYLAKQEEQAKILERQDAAARTLQNISTTLKKLGMSGLVKSVGMTQKSSWVDSAWKKGKNFAGGLAASSIRNVVLEPALNTYMLAEALLTGYTTSSSQMRTTLDLYESSLYYKYVSDPEVYYIGRMAGDAVGLVVGAAEAALGVTSLMTGAVVGGVAIAVSVPLVVEGVIATTVGLSTAVGSINNFSSDWKAYNGYKGGTDVTSSSTNQGKDPFSHANFKKDDIKMVNDVANQVGIDRKEFGNFIHEIKKDLGMKANQNFTYQELIELAEEFANMTK